MKRTTEIEAETEKKTKLLPTDDYSLTVDKEIIPVDEQNSLSKSDTTTVTHQVRHQVALPPNYSNYIPLANHSRKKGIREYPFVLDPFQELSVSAIDRNESVLVSAHTSAGKTVVAEYAIATALLAKQRVIYTSPIKALSNQKYRELSEAVSYTHLTLPTT